LKTQIGSKIPAYRLTGAQGRCSQVTPFSFHLVSN
jgi:hypothetical protein